MLAPPTMMTPRQSRRSVSFTLLSLAIQPFTARMGCRRSYFISFQALMPCHGLATVGPASATLEQVGGVISPTFVAKPVFSCRFDDLLRLHVRAEQVFTGLAHLGSQILSLWSFHGLSVASSPSASGNRAVLTGLRLCSAPRCHQSRNSLDLGRYMVVSWQPLQGERGSERQERPLISDSTRRTAHETGSGP